MPHEFGRSNGHELDQTLIGNEAAVDEHLVAHAVRAFQSDDAVGRLKEAEFLLCQRVRRMVGSQQIHGAVGDGRDGGFAVRFGAQWRIHLGERAVLEQRLVAQRQIVRRGLAGNRQSFGLGPANRLERDGSAHMLEVHVDTGAAGRFDIAGHDLELGVFRNAGHAKLAGNGAFVHGTCIVMLAMLDQVQVGGLDVLQHLVQDLRRHSGTVVADCGDGVREHGRRLGVVLESGHVPEPVGNVACLMTGAILGRAHAQIVTNRQLNVMRSIVLLQEVDDVVEAGIQNLFRTGRFQVRHGLPIQCRQRVRHDEHVRVSAGCGRAAAGDHRFLVGLAGIAEVDVRVFETGGHGQSGGVDIGTVSHGGGVGEVGGSGPGHHEVDDLAGVPDLDVA